MIVGQTIRVSDNKGVIKDSIPVAKYVRLLQMSALLGINPIITLGAFWGTKLGNVRFLALPILGACALSLGGVLGYSYSRLMKHDKRKTGSMFVSGSFTNIGNFGGLICFVFFGESSYVYVSMYKLLEEFSYFIVGYPIAKMHGEGEGTERKKNTIIRIITDPFVAVYFISIFIGTAINVMGFVRPMQYQTVNEILIPLSSILLVVSVGYNMRIKAVKGYLRECLAIASVKFLFVPVVITCVAYFIGLGAIMDGLLLKVVLVLSAMPPAFNSLIPPQIYNLDTDLANSAWIFCTGMLALVVPLLYVIQSII